MARSVIFSPCFIHLLGGRHFQDAVAPGPIEPPRACINELELAAATHSLRCWFMKTKHPLSAMLAGPVLAQGASSDSKMRGGAQGKSNMQQGGASGSADEELNAQPGAAGEKAGAKAGTKGTVGAGSGAPKATGGAAADPATGGKRY